MTDEGKKFARIIENGEGFRTLVENLNGILFFIDNKGIIQYISPYVHKLAGYTPDEVIGRPFADFIYPDDLSMTFDNFKKTIKGTSGPSEYRIVTKSGEVLWVRSYSRIIGTATEPEGLHGLLLDITELKRTEEVLKESRLSIEMIFNTINDMLFVIDSKGEIIKINKRVSETLGYPEDQIIGKHVSDMHPSDRLDEVNMTLKDIFSGQKSICLVPIITREGKLIPVETRVTHGELNGQKVFFGVSRDITENLEAEEKIKEKTEELDQFFKYAVDLLCVADTDGYFRRLNVEWENTLGYSLAELEGQRFLDFVHPDDMDATLKALEQLADQKEVLNFVNRYRCKDNSHKWIEWRSYPAGNKIYAAARDITERKLYTEERDRLIQKLEAKNRELESFAYTVSHDLKSPLLTIKGFIKIMEDSLSSGSFKHIDMYLDRIRNSVDKMMRLIEDLLEFSKMTQPDSHPVEISFKSLVDEALSRVSWHIEEHNVRVKVKPDLPRIYGDPPRLIQVLQNLIDNAIKFSEMRSGPEIEIGARKDNRETVFYIRDNGIGIDRKYHERVFNLFEKIDAKSPGSGVGLALVKRIIELHNGKIWIESNGKNKGSTFCFTLPLAQKN